MRSGSTLSWLDDLRARAPHASDVLSRLASLKPIDTSEARDAFAEVRENVPNLLDEFHAEYDRLAHPGLVLPFTASEREQLSRQASREMHEWIAAEQIAVKALTLPPSAPQTHTGRLGGGRRRGSTSTRRHRCASGRSPDDPHDLARLGGCRPLRSSRGGRA